MADDNFSPDNVRLIDRLEAMDKEINAWRGITHKKLFQRLLALGIDDKIKLAKTVSRIRFSKAKSGKTTPHKEEFLSKSLGSRLKKRQGDIESISFSFVRHGIFVEHGVGRGRPVGSSQANPHKKPWLSIVLPPSIEDLADVLENEYADIAALELRFLIPGILDTTVSSG